MSPWERVEELTKLLLVRVKKSTRSSFNLPEGEYVFRITQESEDGRSILLRFENLGEFTDRNKDI